MPWFDWNCLDEAFGFPPRNLPLEWEEPYSGTLPPKKSEAMKEAHREGAKAMWVDADERRAKAAALQAKTHRFRNPEGEVVEIYDLKKFCEENGYTRSNFINLRNGKKKRGNYRGWTNA